MEESSSRRRLDGVEPAAGDHPSVGSASSARRSLHKRGRTLAWLYRMAKNAKRPPPSECLIAAPAPSLAEGAALWAGLPCSSSPRRAGY